MRIRASTAVMSAVAAMTIATGVSSAWAAFAGDQAQITAVQYDRYPDQRPYYPDRSYSDRYYPPPPPAGGYSDPRDRYGERETPRWRPGDVLPDQFLDFIVPDWEERGLERPPGGHQWVRVGLQFILVRERDRMISRVINFD
jgi:Ni/Co efflux regulator RcnB